MARPDKVAAVQEIKEKFEGSSAALLTEYRGLTVGQIAEVRGALREANAEYKVLKNSLARIAVREVGLEELVDELTGPTAVAFVQGDAVEAARALDNASGKYPVLVVKGGVLDGKFMTADQTKQLAKLEPRETQLAKIAMMMNQPAQLTINVLAALLRDLGSMLAQVTAKKESGELPGGEEPAAEAATEEPAAEPATEESAAEAATEEAATKPAAETSAEEPVVEEETETPEEDAAEGGAEKEE